MNGKLHILYLTHYLYITEEDTIYKGQVQIIAVCFITMSQVCRFFIQTRPAVPGLDEGVNMINSDTS